MTPAFVLIGFALFAAPPSPYQAFFPANAEAHFVMNVDSPALQGRSFAFDVSADGQPFLASQNTFYPVGARADRMLPPFRVAGLSSIEQFAFMRDGALLAISGKTLFAVTPEGGRALAALPEEKMRVAAGSAKDAYLVGGASVFTLSQGGAVEHLLRAPKDIDALASDGSRLVIACGQAILELKDTGAPRLVAALPEPVRSLAIAPDGALFYSTAAGVGYVSARGGLYPFVNGKGAQLRVSGESLFLFFEDEGILKVSPAESFADLARSIDAARGQQDGGR